MNSLIKKIFADFKVDDKKIPVSFLKYTGKETTYITYQSIDNSGTLAGDDEILGYIDYYDFDIYSKSNYFKIVRELKKILKANGFIWQPSMSSGDMYEDDTGYFHKTLCFAREVIESEE
jgi:hypothetical protein